MGPGATAITFDFLSFALCRSALRCRPHGHLPRFSLEFGLRGFPVTLPVALPVALVPFLLCFGLLGLLGLLRLLGLLGLFGLGAAHELVVVLAAAEFAAVPERWALALHVPLVTTASGAAFGSVFVIFLPPLLLLSLRANLRALVSADILQVSLLATNGAPFGDVPADLFGVAGDATNWAHQLTGALRSIMPSTPTVGAGSLVFRLKGLTLVLLPTSVRLAI